MQKGSLGLYCSADPWIKDLLLVNLRALFSVGKEKRGDFIYCGLQVSAEVGENGQVTSNLVDQRTYIEKIVPMEISHSTGSQDGCLEQQENPDYRGILWALLWALTSMRLDHAYRICKLSQQTGAPTLKSN